MIEIMVKHYKCEHCYKTSQWAREIESHEKNCLKEQESVKARQELYRKKIEDAIKMAINAAKKDKALKLLVDNNLIEEARRRCDEIYWSEVCFDHYSSSWFEEVFTRMIESVKEGNPCSTTPKFMATTTM